MSKFSFYFRFHPVNQTMCQCILELDIARSFSHIIANWCKNKHNWLLVSIGSFDKMSLGWISFWMNIGGSIEIIYIDLYIYRFLYLAHNLCCYVSCSPLGCLFVSSYPCEVSSLPFEPFSFCPLFSCKQI